MDSQSTDKRNYDAQDVKARATGRWRDILTAVAHIDAASLTGKNGPCPKCGGTDRFSAFKDVDESGGVHCRHCHPRGGDGLATIQWANGCDFPTALAAVAEYLGMTPSTNGKTKVDIVEAVARAKSMPVDAFKQFGAVADKRNKKDVARVPVYNQAGEVHSHFDLTPTGKGLFKSGKGASGCFLPGRKPAAGEIWLLVEGVKDAAALVGLGFNAAGLPGSFLDAKYAALFRDCHIVLVPDLDDAGMNGAQKSGGNLAGIAASVKVARLPGEVVKSGGADVRDALKKPGGEQAVRDAIDNAVDWTPREGEPEKDERPEVFITSNESYVAEQVVKHLGNLGWASDWIPAHSRENVKVYQRQGEPVQVVAIDEPVTLAGGVELQAGDIRMRPMPAPIIRERVTQACRLVVEREDKDGNPVVSPVTPPKWLTDNIACRGHYDGMIRPLAAVIQSPTIRPDGSILQRPGYDGQTGLLLRIDGKWPKVPDKPSRDDAHDAALPLLEVVRDFPFASEADRAGWLALPLTLIGRPAITGCTPFNSFTANCPGTGKGLLVDAAHLIGLGRMPAKRTYTRDDNEMRKAITSIAIEGLPAVVLDNVNSQLGGAALDAALTSTVWSDRILGVSRTTGDLPLRAVWTATGNNLSYGSDLARRVLPIRLQTELERPEERDGFKHPNLLAYVADQRRQLAIAALTMLRAYFVAGMPKQSGNQWGSFESWAEIVRGTLLWLGFNDPLETRATIEAQDESREMLGLLIAGLQEADPDGQGVTVKEIERLTQHKPDETPTCPALQEAAALICGAKFDGRKFAYQLKKYQGRIYRGMKIASGNAGGNAKRWRVIPASELGELGELVPNHPTREAGIFCQE